MTKEEALKQFLEMISGDKNAKGIVIYQHNGELISYISDGSFVTILGLLDFMSAQMKKAIPAVGEMNVRGS